MNSWSFIKGAGLIHINSSFAGFWYSSNIYEQPDIYLYLCSQNGLANRLCALSQLKEPITHFQLYRFRKDDLEEEIRLFIINTISSSNAESLECFLENILINSSPTFQKFLHENSSLFKEETCTISTPSTDLNETTQMIDLILSKLNYTPLCYNKNVIYQCEKELFSQVFDVVYTYGHWEIKQA